MELIRRLGECYSDTESATLTTISLLSCFYYTLENRQNGLEALKILVEHFKFDPFGSGHLFSALCADHRDIVLFLLDGKCGVDPAKILPGIGGMSAAATSDLDLLALRCSNDYFELLREAALRKFDKYKDEQMPANYSGFECDTMKAIQFGNTKKLKENFVLALRLTRVGFPFPLRKQVLQGTTEDMKKIMKEEILAKLKKIVVHNSKVECVIEYIYLLYFSNTLDRTREFSDEILKKVSEQKCHPDQMSNLVQAFQNCGVPVHPRFNVTIQPGDGTTITRVIERDSVYGSPEVHPEKTENKTESRPRRGRGSL